MRHKPPGDPGTWVLRWSEHLTLYKEDGGKAMVCYKHVSDRQARDQDSGLGGSRLGTRANSCEEGPARLRGVDGTRRHSQGDRRRAEEPGQWPGPEHAQEVPIPGAGVDGGLTFTDKTTQDSEPDHGGRECWRESEW